MFQRSLQKVMLISDHKEMACALKENFQALLPTYFTLHTEVVVVNSAVEAAKQIDASYDLIINDGKGSDKKSPALMNLLKENGLIEKTLIMSWKIDATKFDLREFDWELNIISKHQTEMCNQLKLLFP